jgi:hypothetical protein
VTDAAPMPTRPGPATWQGAPPSARYSLAGTATVLMILLAVNALSWLGAIGWPVLAAIGEITFLASMIAFVTWLYRARVNADDRGWYQRRSPGWAIGAWFVPVVNAFYPFQIMADIWRAGLPAEARKSRAVLPGIWWGCWLALDFLAGFGDARTVRLGSLTFYADIWTPGKIALVLYCAITASLVMKVSQGPLGRQA